MKRVTQCTRLFSPLTSSAYGRRKQLVREKKKWYWFYISSSGSRLLNHHSTLDGWGKDIFVKEYTCEYNKEKVDILRMGKRTFYFVMYLVYGLTLYFIWHFMYIFVLCAGGLITICATIYCFDNELQEQLLTAYGFLCLYCLYKVSHLYILYLTSKMDIIWNKSVIVQNLK